MTLAAAQVSVGAALAVLLGVPVLIGGITGAIMRPREPWRDTFEVAAAGTVILAAVLALVIIAALVANPSECSHGQCHSNDNQAGVQVVFAAFLAPLLYPFVLIGAAAGKLLARGMTRMF